MSSPETQPPQADSALDYDDHAKRWEASRMKQEAYCQAAGLNYPRFVVSRSKRLAEKRQSKKQRSPFIPVIPAAVSSMNRHSEVILLRLPKGSVIELPSTLAPNQLSIVLKSLGRQLC